MNTPPRHSNRPTRRGPPMQAVLLAVHGVGWLIAMVWVTITSEKHLPPAELWTALPLGISAILVAFRNSRKED